MRALFFAFCFFAYTSSHAAAIPVPLPTTADLFQRTDAGSQLGDKSTTTMRM